MPKIAMAGSTVMVLPALKALRLAIENGFEAFEIFGEFPQCVCEEFTTAQRDEGKAMLSSSGVELIVHAPFNGLNPASLNPGVRRESVRQIKDAIDLCADMGGTKVVVHNGEHSVPKRVREAHPEVAKLQWDYNVASLKEAAIHARERGVILCLENIGFEEEHMDRNVADLLVIRGEVDEPSLAFCIDIGHARLNNELDRAIEQLGPMAAHIHFTDNFGERDDHVVIGEGNFDYTTHLDFFRNFPQTVTLEVVVVGSDPAPAAASKINFMKIICKE